MDGMTIEEAIKHCEEVAEKNEEECKNWAYGASQINDDENRKKQYQKHAEMWHECASEHRQLAEWLRELKMYREVIDNKSFEITDPLDPHRHHVLVVKVTDLYNDFFDF